MEVISLAMRTTRSVLTNGAKRIASVEETACGGGRL